MGSVEFRVELPSHSYAFEVRVGTSDSVSSLKRAISTTCTGSPRPDGQRLIWRGRILKDDELVGEVWKSPNEPRVIHLSVHPSAWTSSPPNSQAVPAPAASTHNHLAPPNISVLTPGTAPLVTGYSDTAYANDYFTQARARPSPMNASPAVSSIASTLANSMIATIARSASTEFLLFRHNNALLAMLQAPLVPEQSPESMSGGREAAMSVIKHYGWTWPSVLDEPYPEVIEGEAGAKYERAIIGGQEYMTLLTPDAIPTARQVHALKVLGHTFPLLSLTVPNLNAITNVRTSRGLDEHLPPAMLPALNNHLRQLGMPPVRARNAAIIRPLLLPIAMLTLRTFILFWMFSPTRKPLLALAIGAWVIYELYVAVFAALGPNAPAGEPRPNAAAPAPAGGNPQDVAVRPAAGGAAAVVAPGAPRANANLPMIAALESISQLNLTNEQRTLEARLEDEGLAAINAPPSTLQKAKSFVTLFASTLHPAIWDRRRATLIRREGQIRTEGSVRERQDEEPVAEEGEIPEAERARRREEAEKRRESREALQAKHARRPRWVKEYIERVRAGEWVD